MRMPPCSRNRRPGAPGKRATAAFRPIHRRRLSFPISGKGWCGRRGLRASCSDDRLSALTDDLLLLILRRLVTRTALATATLSKRWSCLPRCLDALDFRVTDILPARYYQWISIHGKAANYAYGFGVDLKVLRDNIKRYERRAMRAMTSSINNFLDADDDQDRGSLGLRRLRLDFFPGHCSSGINRLIAKAADSWGVEDLEVLVKNTFQQHFAHSFPHHGLCYNPHNSRLRSLKLAACYIPPLKGFHALTSLVLQDLPDSTPTAAYEAIFTLCPQLQALHLKSCMLNQGVVAVHAPKSLIKQLIMEHCWFGLIKLYTLPMLESMAVLQTNVSYELSSFPYLTHLNIAFHRGVAKTRCVRVGNHYDLNQYLGGTPGISDLILRFTGYHRWFKPWSPTLLFPKLRRLLIADVPSSWDVSWPRLLIEAAPCLECLHIHITPWEEEPHDDISWEPSEFCHNQLKELVIIGFQGTERQIYFVNFVIKVSTSLQLVSLYKNGHVQDRGRWDWDMVTQQYRWVNEEKVKILNQIADSAPCAATPVQVVLE
ncbi:hypothetical protein BDA96_09G228200 [Sorghum bicolor]|uniref:At1g61320/AtMIF1 LRR domain-containing protein n=1 Tax=Sorghum bicolor TaxID=4558 RepID=A0A921U5M2_SORBI|nr:hypothetical protein BDA96_09G228200 [Sorghum bicolor]